MKSDSPRATTLKLAGAYFGIVFAAGFVLGAIRTLWLEPQLGERYAELLEAPVMVAIYTSVAFYLVGRWRTKLTQLAAIVAGLGALAILLAFEFTVVLQLRGLSFAEYLASRDWLAGLVYVVSLAAFAAMPAFAFRRGYTR